MQAPEGSKGGGRLVPHQAAYRASPFRFRGLRSFRDGYNAFCGRPERLSTDFVIQEIREKAMVLATRQITLDLGWLNEVNKLLSLLSAKSVRLLEAGDVEIVRRIRLVCRKVFIDNDFPEASPLDFADGAVNDKEMSLWELILQIRGRCLQLELLYELKRGTRDIISKLEEQIRDLLVQNGHLAESLQREVGFKEELERQLAQQFASPREAAGPVSRYVEGQDDCALRLRADLERVRGHNNRLVQERDKLQKQCRKQESRLMEQEGVIERLRDRLKIPREPPEVVETEVIVKVRDESRIQELEREIAELKEENAFYKGEREDVLALYERVSKEKRDLLCGQQSEQEALQAARAALSQFKKRIAAANEEYQAALPDPGAAAVVLYAFLEDMDTLQKDHSGI